MEPEFARQLLPRAVDGGQVEPVRHLVHLHGGKCYSTTTSTFTAHEMSPADLLSELQLAEQSRRRDGPLQLLALLLLLLAAPEGVVGRDGDRNADVTVHSLYKERKKVFFNAVMPSLCRKSTPNICGVVLFFNIKYLPNNIKKGDNFKSAQK